MPILNPAPPLEIKVFSLAANVPSAEFPLTNGTPNAITASLCRIMPFTFPGTMTVNRIGIRNVASLADCMQLGLFDSAGARVWTSGALSAASGWQEISTNLPISLTNQTYYWGLTNNNLSSATSVYTMSTNIGSPWMTGFGTVPATNGVMPSSITPGSITKTIGGWPCYVLFLT